MRRLFFGGVLFAAEVSEFACSSRLRRSHSEPESKVGAKQHPLDPDCKEPADPPRTADGEGPSEIFCCNTAKKKLEHLKRREKDCNDAVPCSESWKQLLPGYMDYYQGLEKVLCRTTTTTTTTTVTTITTTKEKVTESTTAAATTAAPTTPTTTTAKPAFSCQDSCLEIATDDESKCSTLCDKVEHELTKSCSPTQCSWIQIHTDSYCSQNFKQLSKTGSGTSADECEQMVSSDPSCGNFMHHNEDMCVCVLAGHACDFKKSTRGNKVYAKAEDCQAEPGAKAEQEPSSSAASEDGISENKEEESDDEFNKEQEKALEKEQKEHAQEDAAGEEQDTSASEDQGDDAEEGAVSTEDGQDNPGQEEPQQEEPDAEEDENKEQTF